MEEINHLIAKFWRGEISKAEMEHLLAWLDQHGEDWRDFLSKRFLHNQGQNLQDEQARRLLLRINESITKAQSSAPHKPKFRKIIFWSKLAAAVLVLLVISLLFLFYLPSRQQRATIAQQKVKIYQAVNRDTGTVSFTLPDHSIVRLDPSTSISYDDHFAISNRDIKLSGKAYFKVAKYRQAPFHVSANGIITTALGTSFVIHTIGMQQVSVQLLSGKVVITPQKNSGLLMKPIYLNPGQILHIDKAQSLAKITNISTKTNLGSTKTNHPKPFTLRIPLNFDKEPLSHVFEQLSTRFQRHLVYNKDELAKILFTGSYAPNDRLLPWLKAVSRMNGLECQERNHSIYIFPSKTTNNANDTLIKDEN